MAIFNTGGGKENQPESLAQSGGVSHQRAMQSLSQLVSATACNFSQDAAQMEAHAKLSGKLTADLYHSCIFFGMISV